MPTYIPSISISRDVLVRLYVGLALGLALWDIFIGGQIAQFRRSPRPLAALSAVSALLLAPALLIGAAAASSVTGHTFDGLSWFWPVTMLLITAQACYATFRRMISPFAGIPIVAYDLLLTVVAIVRFITAMGDTPPEAALALATAHVNVLGYIAGPAALAWPYALQPGLLAPAFPPRWRLSRTLRALLATFAAAWFTAAMLALPSAWLTITSYDPLSLQPLQERPAGDFVVGLRLLPTLQGAPSAGALRSDLSLVDTIGAEAVSVRIDPRGTRPVDLDSLGRALDPLRRDTTTLIVTLESYQESHLAELSRIVRRLHPDYLVVADEPIIKGDSAFGGPVSTATWIKYLTAAAFTVHRIDPKVRVAVAITASGARDSVLYEWAASPNAPIDVVGFVIRPLFAGASDLDAQMRSADRWIAAAGQSQKENWIFATYGYPVSHGEINQERAIWSTLAWATSRPAVKGVIVADAADYGAVTGLRAPSGRLRHAANAVARAAKSLRETAASP
ncbi:MAG TPA: hypothetical protein VFA43_17330 [Gemmatimonadaceae bacterium]|nr:hypothetical protein [Gemmatimonadaceae bacterium]